VGRAGALTSELIQLREASSDGAAPAATAPYKCAACHKPAEVDAICFPCGHAWHERCLPSAAACPMCGVEVVESISRPFIDDDEEF